MIRIARADDRPAILEVHRAAFGGDEVPRLVEELWASEWYEPELSFVAEDCGAVIGHVMNTWVGLEGTPLQLLQLSRSASCRNISGGVTARRSCARRSTQ